MNRIVFTDTMGSEYISPNNGWLRDKVLNGDDTFWEGSSGDCLLCFEEKNTIKSSINIIARSRYGFKLAHGFAHEPSTYMLMHGSGVGNEVSVYVGGNPLKLWRNSLVPKELAWEAIEYFLQTGDRKSSLNWQIEDIPTQDA